MEKADVLIVGAGPAGSACARHLVQNGCKVILLDKSGFPRVKLCAGWITPRVFHYLGITPDSYPLSLTRFNKFRISIKGFSFTLPTNQFAIRRIEFDQWLLEKSGADFWQHEIRSIESSAEEFVVDGLFSAPILVGAGGTNCPVYKKIFQPTFPRQGNSLIVSLEEEFPYDVKDDRCRLWFFENGLSGYSWYVPKQGGYVNVGIGAHQSSLEKSKTNLRSHWNTLIDKLKKENLIPGHEFQPTGHSYFLRNKNLKPRIGNAFLVGDSLGLATRDMGEGIGAAIRSGQLAAEAIMGDIYPNYNEIPLNSIPSILGLRH
jgi:menaquinone-9 beta-reductase